MDKKNRYNIYIKNIPLFTPLKNSTCCAIGKFSSVSFKEKDLTCKLVCRGRIVRITSNFGDSALPGYQPVIPKKITNRGRKKKVVAQKRRIQGSGKAFNSCIQFSVKGEKIYKIKLFRNGSFQIPGILREDMSDILAPLDYLRKYLCEVFGNVKLLELRSVMKNYKFNLIGGEINLQALREYYFRKFASLVNINEIDTRRYLVNPVRYGSWSRYADNVYNSNLPELKALEVNVQNLVRFISTSNRKKNVLVTHDNLREFILDRRFDKYYHRLLRCLKLMHSTYKLSEKSIRGILTQLLISPVSILVKKASQHVDNELSDVRYDQEKYSGFLIKIKTPTPERAEKRTTIKIFPSGKVNMDGANSRQEADFIYWWLNDLFIKNGEFWYDERNYDSDDEFSMSDSE